MKTQDNGIIYLREYGRINLKLKECMEAKGITRNALARQINTRFEVIDRWYKNNVEVIDLDILARICFVFSCSVSDILEYNKPETDEYK